MSNLEQIIVRQEEEFKKKFVKYGLGKSMGWKENDDDLIPNILTWHSSSIKEILEGAVEREKAKIKEPSFPLDDSKEAKQIASEYICYNEAKSDTINYLQEIIKKL